MADYYRQNPEFEHQDYDFEFEKQEEAEVFNLMNGTPVSTESFSEPEDLDTLEIPNHENVELTNKVVPLVAPMNSTESPQVQLSSNDDLNLMKKEEVAASAEISDLPISQQVQPEPEDLNILEARDFEPEQKVDLVNSTESLQVQPEPENLDILEGRDLESKDANSEVEQKVDPVNQIKTLQEPSPNSSGKKSQKPNKTPSTTEYIHDFIENADLFLNTDGVAYATIKVNGIERDMPIGSERFKKLLKVETYRASGKSNMPSEYDIRDAVGYAEGLAYYNEKVIPVHTRMDFNGDRLVLDLCNPKGEIVYLDRDGWDVRPKGPEKFHQPSYMEELPTPVKNGSIRPFLEQLNIKDQSNAMLIATWMIAALNTSAPRPLLSIYGSPGAGKSTFARIIKSQIDPSKLDLLSIGRNEQDFAVQMQGNAIVVFDNETSISKGMSNVLCKAITGGSNLVRMYYTNKDASATNYSSAMIMTAIQFPFEQADLRERALPIELERILGSERKTIGPILKRFESIKAETLGGILNVFQQALKVRDQMTLDDSFPKTKVPRMIDFYHTGCAIAEVIGYGAENFAEVMDRSICSAYSEKTESEPLAAVIASFLEKNFLEHGIAEDSECAGVWYANAINHAPSIGINPQELPKAFNAFTRKLKSQVVDMEHLGWEVKFSSKTNPCRYITFKKLD